MNNNKKIFRMTLGGICLALTVISMYASSIVPGIELTLLAISSLFTAVMLIETGVGGALLLYDFIFSGLINFYARRIRKKGLDDTKLS